MDDVDDVHGWEEGSFSTLEKGGRDTKEAVPLLVSLYVSLESVLSEDVCALGPLIAKAHTFQISRSERCPYARRRLLCISQQAWRTSAREGFRLSGKGID